MIKETKLSNGMLCAFERNCVVGIQETANKSFVKVYFNAGFFFEIAMPYEEALIEFKNAGLEYKEVPSAKTEPDVVKKPEEAKK